MSSACLPAGCNDGAAGHVGGRDTARRSWEGVFYYGRAVLLETNLLNVLGFLNWLDFPAVRGLALGSARLGTSRLWWPHCRLFSSCGLGGGAFSLFVAPTTEQQHAFYSHGG